MHRLDGFRFLVITGTFLTAATAASCAFAQATADSLAPNQLPTQSPVWYANNLRPQNAHAAACDSQLQVVGSRSIANNSAGTLRFVQAIEPATEPATKPADEIASRNDPSLTLAAQPLPLEAEPLPPAPAPAGPTSAPPAVPLPGSTGTYERVETGWKPIGSVSAVAVPPAGELPVDFAGPVFAQAGAVVAPVNATHDWPTMTYAWEASAVPHTPLYFEDVNLERYGYTHGILQPWISGGRFFINVVFLPYHLFNEPPGQLEYPLGYYRPGDKAPPVRQIKPVKLSAVAAEAAFVVGMVILLP
jgi:hypothetical protein